METHTFTLVVTVATADIEGDNIEDARSYLTGVIEVGDGDERITNVDTHDGNLLDEGADDDAFETQLMVCVDGAEFASIPLRDGDDRFNAEAERGALDRAYEAKESEPEAVVSVVICRVPEEV